MAKTILINKILKMNMINIEAIENKEVKKWFLKLGNDYETDMQGILKRGYRSLKSARYIFLQVTDASKARIYLKEILPFITTADKSSYDETTEESDPTEAVQIAFASSGFEKLGMPQSTLATFSREFLEGMNFSYANPDGSGTMVHERSTILGDVGTSAPAMWRWGSGKNEVDFMLMLFAEDDTRLEQLITKVYADDPQAEGVKRVGRDGHTFEFDQEQVREHFGFKDGISQPVIKGFGKSVGEEDEDKLTNPGEFVLGYKNEYDNYSPSPYVSCSNASGDLDALPGYPDKKDLGKNGSYLVFRQIKQDVGGFWNYHLENSKEDGADRIEKAKKLAAKMIVRWPGGQPLVTCPDNPTTHPHSPCKAAESNNDFNYAGMDKDGLRCPFGAHIRRVNPRDQVHTGRNAAQSVVMSKRHRMLRRGRIYGEPVGYGKHSKFEVDVIIDSLPELNGGKSGTGAGAGVRMERGLHFICMVSDIGRQFEFVQSVWANTPTFADLGNEVDPIISPRTDDTREFTTPQHLLRNKYKNVPEFTTVVGGAYFFLPSIRALNYIL
jgi:Dyp-type peroxidase family